MPTRIESFTNPRDNLPNDIQRRAREIDFVSRFTDSWDALRTILGIVRPIRKQNGFTLKSYKAKVTLTDGNVAAGNVIPYSKYDYKEETFGEVNVEKYAKAVPIEDVLNYGAEVAIERSDDEFLNELQRKPLKKFYDFLNTGALTATAATWQKALAKAQGNVIDKFNKMRKISTGTVGFANVLDLYEYLGDAPITMQTIFGLNYLQNFLGYSVIFFLSEPDIPRGRVISLPVENIILYYIDPGDSDFAKLGLTYTVQGETNLIGFHAQGNYSTAVGETFALMGMTLWAEYLDAISIVDIGNETFTEVAEPDEDANPAAEKWYEKDANNAYVRTKDEEVDETKTYYTRTVTPN
jgi:hypothetical protein